MSKRYLSDIIYGVFVKGKRLPMATFLEESEAEEFTGCCRFHTRNELEVVPLSEVLRFTPEQIEAMGGAKYV